jgi:hypothetical protein
MTEAEWLAGADPQRMLELLEFTASSRKVRLFTAACYRRLWHLLTDERLEEAVRTAELFADALCDEEALKFADQDVLKVPIGQIDWLRACVNGIRWAITLHPSYPETALESAAFARSAALGHSRSSRQIKLDEDAERKAQGFILLDIFGNPFRSVSVDPSWLTSTVVALARGTYDERAFDRLPILADALQDAGCENADILTHLRGDGPHVRGCWALDLILGKQ